MSGETDGPKDLLGDPWKPPRDPRGRKSHRPNVLSREKVGVLKAGGATDEEIAVQLGISVPTLTKYYFRELEHGLGLARNQMLARLYQAGMAGNVSAMKAYLAQTDKGAAARVMRRPAPKPPQPGKKEAARQAAREVGAAGLFAPGRAPRAH